MRRSMFTEAQIAFVLKPAEEGTSFAEVCRRAGIAEATFDNWRFRSCPFGPSETKRLKMLDEENVGLKRLVADLSLNIRKLGLQLKNTLPTLLPLRLGLAARMQNTS